MVMDSRMEREQLKTAVSSQRARYSIVSNTAVGYGTAALAPDCYLGGTYVRVNKK